MRDTENRFRKPLWRFGGYEPAEEFGYNDCRNRPHQGAYVTVQAIQMPVLASVFTALVGVTVVLLEGYGWPTRSLAEAEAGVLVES